MLRALKKLVIYLLFIFLFSLFLDLGLVFSYANSESLPENADAVVVMGAAIYSPALHNRAAKALELYEQKKVPLIVLTGGRLIESDISEAQDAQRYLQKITKKPLNLVLEEKSGTTYENLLFVREKIGQDKNIIIVSDGYHIARSVLTARALGFKKVYWASIDSSYYPKSELWFHYAREIVAMFDYLPKFFRFTNTK